VLIFTLDTEPFVTGDAESVFSRTCQDHAIEHRRTGSPHPWTMGTRARMGRMIDSDLTFSSAGYIAELLQTFVHSYNFRRRLKALGGQTPYDYICRVAAEQPERFVNHPHHGIMGLEIMPS